MALYSTEGVAALNEEKLNIIMKQVKAFPAMPAAAGKLLSLLDDPDSTPEQIQEILRYDPGLTANILKLTNSAYFGIPSKVSSVRQAVVLLGWKRLIQLVMTVCMSPLMNKPVPGYDLPGGELWRHSVAVSVAADILVKVLKVPEADEVFTAALLHDVGKLVLGGFVKKDIEQIEKMVTKGITFDVAEYMVLGTDHAEIGAHILKSWSFPLELVNAVQWHHDPDSCENICILSDIVHIANALGLMVGSENGQNGFNIQPSAEVTDRLGLKRSHLEAMADLTLAGVNKLADSLLSR